MSRRRVVYALAPPRPAPARVPTFLSPTWSADEPWGRVYLEIDLGAARLEWFGEKKKRDAREAREREEGRERRARRKVA